MPFGSYQTYTEPRDESAMMKLGKSSGIFPKAGPSHERMMAKQLEKIRRGMDINMVRERRIEQDTRMNHQLETERLHEVLRQNRVPGLRGAMNARINADRVASNIN
jgi:hypothetical protein